MQGQATASRPTPAVVAMIAGGLLAVVGAVLSWFEISGVNGSFTAKGTDMSTGQGMLAFGVVAAVAGIVVAMRAPKTGGRGWSITALVLASFVFVMSAYSLAAPGDAFASLASSDVAASYGISDTAAEASLEFAVESGLLDVSAKPGAGVAALGSLVAIVGGILGIVWARGRRQVTLAPVPVQGAPVAQNHPAAVAAAQSQGKARRWTGSQPSDFGSSSGFDF